MAVIAVFTVIFLFIPLAKQEKTQASLTAVLDTIKKLVNFYKEEFKNINVDGLYGLRVLEGHAAAIIKKYEAGELHHLSKEIISDIIAIKDLASTICAQALQYVKKDNPKYFQQLQYVVSTPWDTFESRRRQVDFSKAWPSEVYRVAKAKVHLDEEQSDQCMSELIGSHKSGGVPCDISSQCVYVMTAPGLMGYSITHQLLWIMLAEKTGCKRRLEEKLIETKRGSLADLELELCSNNYIQHIGTLKKFHNMVILPPFQDLYLEQLFICPSLGFYEFLHIELLPQIISWQREDGCYGTMARPSNQDKEGVDLNPILEDSDYDYEDDRIQQLRVVGRGINLTDVIGNLKIDHEIGHNMTGRKLLGYTNTEWDDTIVKGRKLLVEKSMSGGCLAHKTGVASGALVIFLRFLCEPDAHRLFNKTLDVKSHPENIPRKDNSARTNQISYHEPGSVAKEKHIPNENAVLFDQNNGNFKSELNHKGDRKPNFDHETMMHGSQNNPKLKLDNAVLFESNQNQGNTLLHHRVLRQNDPLEFQKVEADRLNKAGLNKDLKMVRGSQNDVNVKGVPVNVANPNENVEQFENGVKSDNRNQQGKQPVVLDIPEDDNDQNGDDGDEDGEDDGNDDYDANDNDEYDDNDNGDDDGEYDDYEQGKNKVPVEKDPDYVADDDENDDEYDQENYDDGNDNNDDEDEDYDQDLRSVEQDHVQKSPPLHDAMNKDVLKGHINARNIVNRNDFQSDHDYGDNKRYDDKKKHDKHDDHDRYAYDDNNGDDYDYDDKNENAEIKDSNADIKIDSAVQSRLTHADSVQQNLNISKHHTVSSNSALFVFAFCFVCVVLLAYRFIKKRRIHFRFSPRGPYKV